jgi:hypothetical protein
VVSDTPRGGTVQGSNLSCLDSELRKPSSPGLTSRTVFRGCGLYFCNLLAETNSFGLGAFLLLCLVAELQKPSLPGLEARIHFRSFDLSKIFSWFQGISMLSFGQIGGSVLEL